MAKTFSVTFPGKIWCTQEAPNSTPVTEKVEKCATFNQNKCPPPWLLISRKAK